MRAEHEIDDHDSIGCFIYNCFVRYSAGDTQKMDKHRTHHILCRWHGLAEPISWTLGLQAEETQEGEGDQAIIPQLQDARSLTVHI